MRIRFIIKQSIRESSPRDVQKSPTLTEVSFFVSGQPFMITTYQSFYRIKDALPYVFLFFPADR